MTRIRYGRPWRALRATVAVLRLGAVFLLVLAWMGVTVPESRPAGGVCLVLAVDVSASVQRGGRETAARYLEALAPLLESPDRVGVVAFATGAEVVVPPAPGKTPVAALLATIDEAIARRPPAGPLDPDDTDMAAGLATAASLCPLEQQPAILLLGDGRETRGDVLAEIALADTRLPVFAAAPTPETLPAALVRRLLVPGLAREGASVPLEAVVENLLPRRLAAVLEVAMDGGIVGEHAVTLPPGIQLVALPERPPEQGIHTLAVRLRLSDGLPAHTGAVQAAMSVVPRARVLVVTPRTTSVVASALADRGLAVETIAPGRMRSLDDVHAVVLDDVPRAAMSDAMLGPLARWVADGGAFLVTGGHRFFDDPAWRTSPLARLLPVELQSQVPEPIEREPIALVLVIDRSNSMGYATRVDPRSRGEKMEYARRAALAVLEQLGPRDLVGAFAFDSQPYELSPLRRARVARGPLAHRLRALRHGGGTDFKAALELARAALRSASARAHHVILLTDGDTNRRADDHESVIAGLAADGITVTTIRIGSDLANLALLDRIATATGGTFHHVEDATALPQLMIRDTRRLLDAPGLMVNAPVRFGSPGAILAGLEERELPRIARWATTRLRPDAELRLWLDTGSSRRDPLLATWQVELGRVAVLPVDFHAGAAAWAAWSGFAKLWAQILAWALPPAIAPERQLSVHHETAGPVLRLRTPRDESGPFALTLDDGTLVPLRRVGQRMFEATIPGLAPGLHRARLRAGAASQPVTLSVPVRAGSGREQRAAGVDWSLLRQLTTLTGGDLDPAPQALLVPRPASARARRPIDGRLAAAALVLFLLEVAARRLLPSRRE